LAEPAAELRAAERQIVAEDIQQGGRGIDVDRVGTAIHLECNGAHGASVAASSVGVDDDFDPAGYASCAVRETIKNLRLR
jgi:hypothetical protein